MTCPRLVPLLLLALATPSIATAQADVSAELQVAGANILIGAVTAGLTAWVTGQPIERAMLGGAYGGAVAYAGKRLASARFDGAGFAGRVVHATGASVVRNFGAGRGALDELTVPLGPLSLSWTTPTPRADAGLRARVDVAQVAYIGYLAVHDGYRVDWRSSLSRGVPTFTARGWVGGLVGGSPRAGFERFGVVALSGPTTMGPRAYDIVLTHEATHALQGDFFAITTEPLDAWLLGLFPGGGTLGRYVQLGVAASALDVAMRLLPYSLRPGEAEAYYMDGRP